VAARSTFFLGGILAVLQAVGVDEPGWEKLRLKVRCCKFLAWCALEALAWVVEARKALGIGKTFRLSYRHLTLQSKLSVCGLGL
jgi:hypothetical protein